jgi:hypothetical protein
LFQELRLSTVVALYGIAALRKYGVLTRDQFKCLAREQRLLNAVERALPEFVSLDGPGLTKH